MRKIDYCSALNEALHFEMARDPDMIVFGIGVPDHKSIFGSTRGLLEAFGPERCFDTPLCEDSMTGFALGAALGGMRPVHVHIRVDFLLLAMNQVVNIISSYNYSLGGKAKIPLVIRVIIGRGWGQGVHHSKSLQSFFAHIPGLKVVMPTTPRDAKGLLVSAIRDNNPVVFMEHRWLYWAEDEVPEGDFSIPLGKGKILREGKDITIVATSWMNIEAMHAAKILARHGVDVEVVDPRTIAPLDETLILESVEKTRNCLVADNDWVECGFSSEVAARVSEKCFGRLKSPVKRMGFAHSPCPTVRCLEDGFYPNAKDIVTVILKTLDLPPIEIPSEDYFSHENRFKGPF